MELSYCPYTKNIYCSKRKPCCSCSSFNDGNIIKSNLLDDLLPKFLRRDVGTKDSQVNSVLKGNPTLGERVAFIEGKVIYISKQLDSLLARYLNNKEYSSGSIIGNRLYTYDNKTGKCIKIEALSGNIDD